MKKTNFIILFTFCFSFVLGQKKKQKPLPPPKVETETIVQENNKSDEIQYISPPASNGNINVQKSNKIDFLNLDPNAKKCACDNSTIILAADKFGEAFTAKDFGLRGNVKSVKIVEKRDTLVGYSETLSKGNTVEMTFSNQGFLQTHTKEMMDKWSKSQGLKSLTHVFYDNENQIARTEIYLGDIKNLMAKNHFIYNAMGLYEVKTTDKDNKSVKRITTFECFKNDNQLSLIKKDVNKDSNYETNEMYVFNIKNQLLKKQKILNSDGNTTENKTTAFAYNNSGLLTEENFLKNDGTINNYIHHQYNPQGDLIKSVYKNGDYDIYDYKYDNQNNWIWKQKTSFEKSKFSDEIKIDQRLTWDRTLLYY